MVEVAADATLQLFVAGGGAEKDREMCSGGGADDGDAGGVAAIFAGVGAEPADGGFAIVDLRGIDGVLSEAIANGGDGEARLGEPLEGEFLAIASGPCAAMDVDDEGWFFASGCGDVEVEEEFFCSGFGEDDVSKIASPLPCEGRKLGGGYAKGNEKARDGEHVPSTLPHFDGDAK